MKKIYSYFILVFLGLTALTISYYGSPEQAYSAGASCYSCKGGGFVCYKGGDTFAKRKKALSKYKCNVSGTSSCTKSKCKGRAVSEKS